MTAVPRLDRRVLNRTLLARQHLLTRGTRPAIELIGDLVGMQAQAPLAPYVGLWTRLAGFRPGELADLLSERQVVRASLLRTTVHLVTAGDALEIRPLIDRQAATGFGGHFRRWLDGVDVGAVVDAGRALLADRPRTRVQLRDELAARWPQWDGDTMAYAVSYHAHTVQVTPRGLWGRTGPAAMTTLESWLGRPVAAQPSVDALVVRYLAAFGPASAQDAQTWSGLTGLREVVDRLPDLRRYTDPDGRVLYDLPGGELVDADRPAPVRFLPEYDNVLLSHADRSRIIPPDRRVPLPPGNGARAGTVLVDGRYAADWRVERVARHELRLRVDPLAPLSPSARDEVDAEGERLLAFLRQP